jgi:magnesium transporter
MDSPSAVSLDQQIRALLGEEPGQTLRELLAGTDSVAIADAFYAFAQPEQQMLLGLMAPRPAADVLIELDQSTQEALLAHLTDARAAEYLERMEPDDAADLVELLALERREPVLGTLPPPLRERLRALLAYGTDTAGGLMDPDVVQVRADRTVAEAVADIRSYVERVRLDEFFSIYVVDALRRLVGVVPNWKMLLADPGERVERIMLPDPISVEAHLDQEEVARLVGDHDLISVPVVDSHRRLIGRITVDDVVDVIQEEFSEDLGRLTGTGAEEVREASLAQSVRDRAPWLLVALGGQSFSGLILDSRVDFLGMLPQLAIFIPVIMAMGGNTGVQSASLVIRGLATGEVRLSDFRRRLLREFLIALSMGVGFAGILVLWGLLLTGQVRLGVVVGLSTLVTITIASSSGTVIPMVLRRFNLDPALATGPFLTTLNDVLGLSVYLSIAYALLT